MKKSLIAIVGLGAVSTAALVYNYMQWKINKELEQELEVLNDKLKELNDILDDINNTEVIEEVETTEEEQPKKSKVVTSYFEPNLSVNTERVVEQNKQAIEEVVENVNKETERRDEFLQNFKDNKHEEKIIEVNDMRIDANSPQAFSIYKDTILQEIVDEAGRVDVEEYREWTRDFFNLEKYDTERISTQDIIKWAYEMFDYPINPDLWYEQDEQYRLTILDQLEGFFGTGTIYSDYVTYGNFISNIVKFLSGEYEDISKLEIAAIMLQQMGVFEQDVTANDIFNNIKDTFNHDLRTKYGYGVLGIDEDNIGWFVSDIAENAIRNEVNDFNNYLYDNMKEVD